MKQAVPTTQSISLLPILSVNFIGTLGFSIVLPFLVFLVTRWGGNAVIYGIIGAAYSFFQLIGAPILGRWSDRYGRKRILLLSQLGTLISWLIMLTAFILPEEALLKVESGFAGSFTLTVPLILLFVARSADGITGGNVSVANAYLADVTEDARRNENFGKMAVSSNLGFVVGPLLAGLLGATALGELLPVIAATAISAAATVMILFLLAESNRCVIEKQLNPHTVRKVFGQEQKDCYRLPGESRLSTRQILKLPRIAPLLVIYFLVMLAFNFFYVTFPVYVVEVSKWEVTDTGTFFAVLSALMVLVQGPILKRLSRLLSDVTLMNVGSAALTVSFLFFVASQDLMLYAGAAVMAVGNGLMWPSLVSILSKAAGTTFQGAVQGFAGSIGAVASILGLLIGGLLYDSISNKVFALSAILVFVTFIVSLRMLGRRGLASLHG